MKKILLSLALIALAGSFAIAATRSYFSDQDQVLGNSISAGNVTVNLGSGGSYSLPYFNVTKMKPGDVSTACITVKNDGDMNFAFKLYATGLDSTEQAFADQLGLKVTMNTTDCQIANNYSQYGPTNTVLIDDATLKSLVSGFDNLNALKENPSRPLKPNYAIAYKVEVTMPSNIDNAFQNKELTGDLEVKATQSDNQDLTNFQW